MSKVDSHALAAWLDDTLQAARFKDYCPNGLQVEGRSEVGHIITGVTASEALLRAAVERGADAVLVHHGWMWRNEDRRVIGTRRTRMALALKNDLNLYAYHLPLDAHPTLGNNAQLGLRLGLQHDATFGDQNLGMVGGGSFANAAALAAQLQQTLGRTVTCVSGAEAAPIRRVAWCTGGAQGFFEGAIAAGADAFITGEISEPQAHLARETGTTFIAAGHHATERYGAPAVAAHVAQQLGLEHRFIDIDNPA